MQLLNRLVGVNANHLLQVRLGVISLPGCYEKCQFAQLHHDYHSLFRNISIYFILIIITFLFITIIAMLIYKWIYVFILSSLYI